MKPFECHRAKMVSLRTLFIAVGLLATGELCAQQKIVTTAYPAVQAEAGVGAQHRETVNQAVELMHQGKTTRALVMIEPVVAYCNQQLARDDIRFVSVATADEYNQYLADHGNGEPTEWLDISCASAYTQVGYAHADQRRLKAALVSLDKAIAIAPYYPNPINEKGFVLNQLGRLDEAIAVYRQSIALADRHPSTAYAKAIALRGIGWALVEMGDLDAAQRNYEQSLVLQPGNPTAASELEYIAQIRKSASASTADQ